MDSKNALIAACGSPVWYAWARASIPAQIPSSTETRSQRFMRAFWLRLASGVVRSTTAFACLDRGGDAFAGDLGVEAEFVEEVTGGLAVVAGVEVGDDLLGPAVADLGVAGGERVA